MLTLTTDSQEALIPPQAHESRVGTLSEEFGGPVPQSGRPHRPRFAENKPSRICTTVAFIQNIASLPPSHATVQR